MYNGRLENNIKPVPTNKHGVMSLFRALRNNEFVGMLPDSVASHGDGVWTNFFGQKVFATTLAAKFILLDNVTTFIVTSARVNGGFIVEYIPFVPESNNIANVVQEVYNILERVVLQNPTQYYWSYDRFRIPKSNPRSAVGIDK
jgi:KDO2-lipid IV(A) lauroyltransferase